MSHAKANKVVDMEEFKRSMEGTYSTSIVESTKDESPFAYELPTTES